MSQAPFSYFSASTGKAASGELRLEDYAIAERGNMRVSQLLNQKYADADPRFGTAFEQGMRSLGIFPTGDRRYGITPSTVREVMTGECMNKFGAVQLAGAPSGSGTIVSPGGPIGGSTPASRVFFPEVVMSMMDEHLTSNYDREQQIFNSMLAIDDTIASEVFTQPLIDTSGPETVRSAPIGQNALPRTMVSITTSQVSHAIGTESVGLQISEQAQGHATIQLVIVSLAMQTAGQRKAKLWEDLAAIVAGNKDANQAAMSVTAGTAFDSGFTGGAVTQKGWVKMLNDPTRKVSYDSMIGTLDDLLAIQGRTGRPLMFDPTTSGVNTGNLGTYGVNTEAAVLNFENYMPGFMIVPSGLWAAQGLLVFDSRYFLRRVTNSTASYSATEKMVLQRSDVFRWDSGSMTMRLMDEAGMFVDYS